MYRFRFSSTRLLQKYHTLEKTLSIAFISSCYFDKYQYVEAVANGGNHFFKGDLFMRKVLLATTALVALGGVTAANADISIGGNYEWEYKSTDTGNDFLDDGHITITATNAADNGMTFTAVTTFGGGSDAGSPNTENNYIKATGDFGTVYLGDVDGNSASSLMDGALGRNKDIEGETGYGAGDTDIVLSGGADIIFMSQKMGGLQIGIGADLDDTDASASDGAMDMAVTYTISGISLFASGTSGMAADESNFGVSTSIAGFNVGVGSRSASGSSKAKANDVGVNYTLANGIKIAAYSASGTASDGTTKTKHSNFGASYPIVPGVKLNAETGKNAGDAYTWVAVNMSF